MNYFISTNGSGIDVHVTFNAKQNCKVITSVSCLDSGLVYNLRHDEVRRGSKIVVLKVPYSPKNLIVSVDTDIPNNLSVKIVPTQLRKYDIQIGVQQKEFISLIQAFTLGMSSGKVQPSDDIIKSSNGNFKIVLADLIRDYSGSHIGTPCQIGSKSGIIECDQFLMNKLTISQQVALLCHEFAHFYENPKYGLPKDSEDGADLYGLRLFLAAGYGETEYINAFRKTFKRVDTNENRKRLGKIKAWAAKINEGKVFGKIY